LIKNGLIKGGSLENAVVIRDDAILTTEPLRYPEEFVRHKILDIIGDLSLVGCPIGGHVVAVKPSHTPIARWRGKSPSNGASRWRRPRLSPRRRRRPSQSRGEVVIRDGDELDTSG
jgi:hypothetical protein